MPLGLKGFLFALFLTSLLILGLVFVGFEKFTEDFVKVSEPQTINNKTLSEGTTLPEDYYSKTYLNQDQDETASGKLTLIDTPQGKKISDGPLYINPPVAEENSTLFGIAVGEVPVFRVDSEGNIIASGNLTTEQLTTGSVSANSVSADSVSGSGENLTELNASRLSSGIIPSERLSGSYTGITGLGTITLGAWQGTVIEDAYLPDTITASNYLPLTGGTISGDLTTKKLVTGDLTTGNLTVEGDAALGKTSQDKFTINSTSEFLSPVSIKNSLTVGTSTLTIDAQGNLATTGTLSAASLSVNSVSTGNFSATGAISSISLSSGTISATNISATSISEGGTALSSKYILIPSSSTQGDILYHDGLSWKRLPSGTSGQLLRTLGAGANPQWATISLNTAGGWSDDGAVVRLETDTDSVGIGTLTPQNKLHIKTSDTNGGIRIDSGTANYPLLEFVGNNGAFIGRIQGEGGTGGMYYDSYNLGNQGHHFRINGGANEALTIYNSGNIGVGDTTPLSLFTVGSGDLFQINSSGQVAAGVWQGTAISSQYGGTGLNTSGSTGIPKLTSGTWSINATTSDLAEGTNLYFTDARFDTRFGAKTTDNLTQGTTNLYYTDTQARASLSGTSPIVYNSGTGNISFSSSYTGQASITTVGTLTSGSIGSGFTPITDAYISDDLTIASTKAGSFSYSGATAGLTVTQNGAGSIAEFKNSSQTVFTISASGDAIISGDVFAAGYRRASCPAGMIEVPPSPQDGMDGFCVDKYEAKSVGGIATSQANLTPWVSITQYNARAECIRAGKHLITEKEWQAVAHNIENVGWNWNGGVAGTNQMSDGHSDNAPANSLAADITGDPDDDPCVGTGQTCDINTWDSQRRIYKLSNGQYIWDFGGNVWEWIDQVNEDEYPVYNSPAAGWVVCSASGDGICGNTRTTNDQWYRGGALATRGFLRGGDWSSGLYSGAFALNLGNAPTNTNTCIGFRCSR